MQEAIVNGLKITPADDGLFAPRPATENGFSGARLWWLGQAGFALEACGHRLLIDPYLSDSLAKKYRGKEFDHIRLVPPPVSPESLSGLDFVLCTHAHTDHLDPETLAPIMPINPRCRVVVPMAMAETALARGVPLVNLVCLDAGESTDLSERLEVTGVASAHEALETDAAGHHKFMGYILKFKNFTIYHGGDGVPYPGLAETLAAEKIDLALLPVNGRDEFRRDRGVPGNFTLKEALRLCEQASIPNMIAHHFGMFAFNTVPVAELHAVLKNYSGSVQCLVPELGRCLEIAVVK